MLSDGELLFSRRCAYERGARYVAESFRQNTARQGGCSRVLQAQSSR